MAINSVFDRPEYSQHKARWDARLTAFGTRRDYWDGTVYTTHKFRFGWQLGNRLYRGIKPLHLPFSRAVDVDAGIIPGGWRWPDDAPDKWRTARRTVFDWASWSTKGVLFAHYGAIYGTSVLKIADLRETRRVVVAPIDPRFVMLIPTSAYDQTPALSFYVEQRRDGDGVFEYAEVITPSDIMTFRNGEPVGFEGREPEYENALGFVPYVETQFIDTGSAVGDCTFAKGMAILDELNQMGSYLSDIIKKHADPQWAISGAESATGLKKGDNVWLLPDGATVEALLAKIDIDGVRGFLGDLRDNVHATLPELAFDELKSKTQIATATLELQLMELVLKVKRVRPNLDAGLVQALRMAGRAAETLNLADVAVLNDDELKFDDERPVLRADLNTREKADYLIRTDAPSEAVWSVIGFPQEQIDEWNRIKARNAVEFNARIDSDGESKT